MSIKKEGYRMSINDLVLKVNDVLTGSVLIIALVGIGLLFTFKLGFIQIRGVHTILYSVLPIRARHTLS